MTILYLVAVLALVAAAGFFSSAETAVLAANRMRLRYLAAHANRPASYVLSFLKNPDRFLTSILFGNNVSLVVATTLLTVVIQRYMGEAAGVVAATIAMTVLLTLFSEIIPKSVVLEDPDFFAMAFARPVRLWATAFAPVAWAARVVAGGLFGLVRVRAERLPFATREELRAILTSRGPRGRAEVVQRRMIRRIFTFGETTAGEVMVPLAEVVAVPETATREDVVAALARSGFSKFPVYRETPEEIVGVVIARDLITAAPRAPVRDYGWAPVYVSAEESVEALLPRLQTRRVDLAVVRDGRGRALGILTQEDIVEEVVGEIEDEYDWGVHGLLAQAGGYTADGRLAINYFNERMPAPLPPGDYVTLGGFLASRLGRVPSSGDVLEWPPYRFRVLRATPRAARLVAVEVRRAGNG
ncbi:MAG: HlyC/CorC family transporter [Candidatus Coatesbacteria bacterium]|nr:MAG: HlyC/CorC family transporter [Candidatus Coatesbacteria bacterium]